MRNRFSYLRSRALPMLVTGVLVGGVAYLTVFPVSRALAGRSLACGAPQESRFVRMPGVAHGSAYGNPSTQVAEEVMQQYFDQQELQPRCKAERISGYRITTIQFFGHDSSDPDVTVFDLRFDVKYPLGVGDWIGWDGTSFGPWVLGKHAHVNVETKDSRFVVTGMGMG